MELEEISEVVVDAGYRLHRDLGPGLLESVYEGVLSRMLEERGLGVRKQVAVPIEYRGILFDEGFRLDLLVEESLVVELKAVESLAPVHFRQVHTYLRLLKLPLGLLINFGAPTFKQGVRRVVNGHVQTATSRLRVNRTATHPPG